MKKDYLSLKSWLLSIFMAIMLCFSMVAVPAVVQVTPAGENLVEKAEAQSGSPGNTVYVNNTASLPDVTGNETGELPTSFNLSNSSYNYTWINSTETPGGNLTSNINNTFQSFSSGDVVEFLNEDGTWNWTGQIDTIGNISAQNLSYVWCNFTNPASYNMSDGFANYVPMPTGTGKNANDPFYTIQGAINGTGGDEVINITAQGPPYNGFNVTASNLTFVPSVNVTFDGPVTLSADKITFNSSATNSSITFNGTVQGHASGRNLTVDAGSGDITFNGAVGDNIKNIDVDAGTLNQNALINATEVVDIKVINDFTVLNITAGNQITINSTSGSILDDGIDGTKIKGKSGGTVIVLEALGSIGNSTDDIDTYSYQGGTLTARSTTGGIYITDSNLLSIKEVTANNGNIVLEADLDVEIEGPITAGSGGNVSLNSTTDEIENHGGTINMTGGTLRLAADDGIGTGIDSGSVKGIHTINLTDVAATTGIGGIFLNNTDSGNINITSVGGQMA